MIERLNIYTRYVYHTFLISSILGVCRSLLLLTYFTLPHT
jgi:hypothetical protein